MIAVQRIHFVAEPVFGVECLIAQELKDPAMELVGAILGIDADHCTGREAIGSAEVVGHNAELLGRVGIGERGGQAKIGVHVGNAI